jgi:hypothetical protein
VTEQKKASGNNNAATDHCRLSIQKAFVYLQVVGVISILFYFCCSFCSSPEFIETQKQKKNETTHNR